jgi:hypothetical protein
MCSAAATDNYMSFWHGHNGYRVKMCKFIISLLISVLVTACCTAPVPIQKTNSSPVIESISFPQDDFARQDCQITCQASDPDGDNLQYEWSADNGTITGDGANIMWISPDSMGNYNVSVKVRDGKGGEAIQDISIRVLTNADGTTTEPITLKISLPSSAVVSERRTVKVGTMTKIACDPANGAGDKFSYTWTASGGKLKGKGIDEKTASSVYWTAPPAVDLYTVTVLMTDSEGHEAKGEVVFDVFCCPRN